MEEVKQHDLDCKNLNCPMPIVKIAKTIRTMEINEQLKVTATDPAFKADVEAWIRKTGHLLISYTEEGKNRVALIEKTK
ncbi:sulfurtransferase TusA family protein [Flammeovirga aprica]|uniref:Sulfurtransferase TusA family protein n=1 Tax=Flammeovirga aprica JL-4 TaxID=694437 RepID=A0A7X9RYB2_9BACT|nr:sulfurtransferase TusA family protein [Flammeovirga aprica]NME70966.1 sulfurtransferase TusA family protein [Flammeovirga aprica JL-4]